MLEEHLRGLSDEAAGTVRVATVYSVGLHALPPRLKPFLAAYPRINVHLEYKRTGEVYKDVISGAVDVGIVACPTQRRGVETLPFSEEDMTVICAPEHPLAQEERVHLRQIEGMEFIGFADDIPTRKLVDDRLRLAGVRVRLTSPLDNIETIKNLVEIGPAVSIVPADTVTQEQRAGSLAGPPQPPSMPSVGLRACWSRPAAAVAQRYDVSRCDAVQPEPLTQQRERQCATPSKSVYFPSASLTRAGMSAVEAATRTPAALRASTLP